MIVLDLEGEDGDTPRTLLGQAGQPRRESSGEEFRLEATKTIVPNLAYQLSDVVIFIDTIELRRKEKFVERAHSTIVGPSSYG